MAGLGEGKSTPAILSPNSIFPTAIQDSDQNQSLPSGTLREKKKKKGVICK